MSPITEEEAIAKARSQLGLDPLIHAQALRTHRADRAGEAYYLVIFGEPRATIGVAAVDITTGEIMIHAQAPGERPHLLINAKTAVERAGFPAETAAELVWKSCKGSRSPLYPLWEVSYEKKTVYVDQQGSVWQSLDSSDRGG